MNIDSHLEHLETINPDAIRLAEFASIAVRMEPELLRQIRLEFLPNSDASAEADLWLSPLLSTRSAGWIALSNDAAELLRARLIQKSRDLLKVRDFISQRHVGIPSTISLEEEIVWLVVSSDVGALKRIDNLLKGVLGKILDSPKNHLNLARWFAGATDRFPKLVKETEGYVLLVFVVSALLNGRFIDNPRKDANLIYKKVAQTLPNYVSTIQLWVGFTPRGLSFRHHQVDGYRMIKVPSTNPVLLELRNWDGATQVVSVHLGQEVEVVLSRGKTEIVTLSGKVYLLTPVFLGATFQFSEGTAFSPYHFAYDTKINILSNFSSKIMDVSQLADTSRVNFSREQDAVLNSMFVEERVRMM